jgi:hypothetical protein
MSPAVQRLDGWLRSRFREINTHLEQRYFLAGQDLLVDLPDLQALKRTLLIEGAELVAAIDQPDALALDPGGRYELLGMVGCHIAACHRHEIDSADAHGLTASEHLAGLLGSSLGIAPRYVFAHLAFHSRAVAGDRRTFTTLPDEAVFVELNGLAVLAYQRAAEALRPIAAMGVSNPMTTYLLDGARAALDDVLTLNRRIAQTVDIDRFFLNIRPYFKPHPVNGATYRGVNAGDFAAVNEIDVLLGLCNPKDEFYATLLTEKWPFVPPEDQPLLEALGRHPPLLGRFLDEATAAIVSDPLRQNAELFLDVCKVHGAGYAFHHTNLVKRYLEQPARAMPGQRLEEVTASGPPLDHVIAMLDRLRRLRIARDGGGVVTAEAQLKELRARLAA